MKRAERVVVKVLLFRMLGMRLLRYLSPSCMHVALWPLLMKLQLLGQTFAPCILLQSFGVSHMKFGADAEFRSFTSAQSVTPQLLGFASTRLLQRAVLVVMSWKTMNGLCVGLYGSEFELESHPGTGWPLMIWFSK